MRELKENLNEILIEKQTKMLPENIREGVTILGIEGTLHEGIDTSDATATADDIVSPATAYVDGEKVTGAIQAGYRAADPTQYSTKTALSVQAGSLKNIKMMPDGNRIILSGTNLTVYNKNMDVLNTYSIVDFGVTSSSYYTFDVCNTVNSQGGNLVAILGIKTGNLIVSCLYYKNGELGVKLIETQSEYKVYTGLTTNQGGSACIACYNSVPDKFCVLYRKETSYASGAFSKLSVSLGTDITINVDSTVSVWANVTFAIRDIELSSDDAYLAVTARETYLAGMGGQDPNGFSGVINMANNSPILYRNTICPPIFLTDGVSQYVLFIDNLYRLSGGTVTTIKTGLTGVQFSGVISSSGQRYTASTAGYKYGAAIERFLVLSSTAGTSRVFYVDDFATGEITDLGTVNYGNANICAFSNSVDTIHISSGATGIDIILPQEDIISYLIYKGYRLNNESDATAVVSDVISGKTYYGKDGKQAGTMPNNGELSYIPTTSQQTIPTGYTSGGTIASLEESDDYIDCLNLSVKILDEYFDYEYHQGLRNNGTAIMDIPTYYESPVTIEASGHFAYTSRHDMYMLAATTITPIQGDHTWIPLALAFNAGKLWARAVKSDGSDVIWMTADVDYNNDVIIKYNDANSNWNVNGSAITSSDFYIPNIDLQSIRLFGVYDTALSDNGWTVHYVRVYDKTTRELLYELLPVRQKSTNKIGFLCKTQSNVLFYEVPDNNFILVD